MRGLPMFIIAIIFLVVAVAGLLYATGAGGKAATRPAEPRTRPAAGSTTQPSTQPTSKPTRLQVVIDTNLGPMVVELDEQLTPATVKNFLQYVDDRFYDGVIFHRVLQGFMIQAGGFTTDLRPKKPPYPPVVNESREAAGNTRGTIAMARTNHPDSATSQFFINHSDNRQLDTYGGGYTVFGRVVEGMEVVDKIAKVPVRRTALSEGQPVDNVVIRSIRRK